MLDPKPRERIRDSALLQQLHLEYEGEPCARCERHIGVLLHHKTLRSQGGDDTRENLEWLCRSCHNEAHGLAGLDLG